jgi:hypothetical protein
VEGLTAFGQLVQPLSNMRSRTHSRDALSRMR